MKGEGHLRAHGVGAAHHVVDRRFLGASRAASAALACSCIFLYFWVCLRMFARSYPALDIVGVMADTMAAPPATGLTGRASIVDNRRRSVMADIGGAGGAPPTPSTPLLLLGSCLRFV
eukprot:COSAG05_NODE_1654_length_4332_cov_9.405150_2_plen_118_part_00